MLLESASPYVTGERPDQPVVVEGSIYGGKIVSFSRNPRRARRLAVVAIAVALVAGVGAGVALANRALTPAPVCASGSLEVEGSTAFAPVANQVASEYEQDCPAAQITVRAIGSGDGLSALETRTGGPPIIAMHDGLPPQPPASQYLRRAVGVVIFAVVGNTTLQPVLFQPHHGMTPQAIARAYSDPRAGGSHFAPVSRTGDSGTRLAFIRDVLGSEAPLESPGITQEKTTQKLLTYVNQTKDAIGYAEADALPFFPSVRSIPIDGYEPSRANALAGHYQFLATEHLYTNGVPRGLTADFINFLTSQAVTVQLRDTSFIGCADLGGSRLSGHCAH